MDIDALRGWIGRTETARDDIGAVQVRQLAATLGDEARLREPGVAPLPAGWHWLFFNPTEAQAFLGPDGHPARGDFLPPVELPRRMWAGSRLRWTRAFEVGRTVTRDSEILDVRHRAGRSGDLVFVTVGHRYADEHGLLLDEEHDIVYRGEASDADRAALVAVGERARAGEHEFERRGEHVREIDADPVMLFRYSAATFNGHRIHYDADYARDVEGYPGLVVHGPLIATLLLQLIESDLASGRFIESFEFRALRPTFDLGPFHLHASATDGGHEVWSSDNVGRVAVSGRVSTSSTSA